MVQIERLGPEDREAVLDHLDFAFGEVRPHDLERALPHCYRPENMAQHLAVRENGQIRALLGVFERPWQVGEHRLEVSGIGGVSTHRRARGQGLMAALMEHAVADMERAGVHLGWLQGHRRRYARFGFERAGVHVKVRLRTGDVAGHPARDVRFEPLEAGDARLGALWDIHEGWPVRHLRPPARFHDYLRAWQSDPWVALDGQGGVLGWISHQPQARVLHEVGARDAATRIDLACAWVRQRGADHRWLPTAEDPELVRGLSRIAGGDARIEPSGNWRVFAWKPVLEAVLALRARGAPVVPGVVAWSVAGGPALRVESDGVAFAVEEQRGAAKGPVLDALTATRTWFGPLRPSLVTPLRPEVARLLDAWCPLPLVWAVSDGV